MTASEDVGRVGNGSGEVRDGRVGGPMLRKEADIDILTENVISQENVSHITYILKQHGVSFHQYHRF